MPKFKAVAERIHPPAWRPKNPFLIRDVFDKRLSRTIERRTWEFEAANEREVRKHFADAQAMHVENVAGFELVEVKELLPEDTENGDSNG